MSTPAVRRQACTSQSLGCARLREWLQSRFMTSGGGDRWLVDLSEPWDEERAKRLLGKHPWLTLTRPDLPFPIHARFGRSDDGRLVCTGLLVAGDDPREITSRSLRAIPMGDVVEQVAAARDDQEVGAIVRRVMGIDDEPKDIPRRRPGGGGYGREHFEQVATAYRAALATSPRAPMKELARRLSTSEATARRWVQRARDMGLLGASQPGKAGELSEGMSVDGDD